MVIQNKNPLASVIIPVLNSEKYLQETIESVLRQDYFPIEIIVMDGNSNDNTENICKNFSQIKFYRQNGKGISEALNQGIEKSDGEFISFISGDDLWMPHKLSKQIQFMINNPQIQYTVTKAKFFLEPGCDRPSNFREEFLEKETVQHILETLVTRKSLFSQLGVFDTTFSAAMEMDWFARAIDNNIPSAIIIDVLTHKRVHYESTTQNTEDIINQIIRVMHKSISRKKTKK